MEGEDLPRKGAQAALVGPVLYSYTVYHADINASCLSSWSVNRELLGLSAPARAGMYLEA